MPKKSVLRFHDVQEAIDWAKNTPANQVDIRSGFGIAFVHFTLSRPSYHIREACLEGVHLFEKAAARASELSFELEVYYVRRRESTMPPDHTRIEELAQELVRLSQKCHAWGPEDPTGITLDAILQMIPSLDHQNESTKSGDGQQPTAASTPNKLSRDDLLPVPPGRGVTFPDHWLSDPQRMRTTAINLRRVSSRLQAYADHHRRRNGGRPQDGDAVRLIAEVRSFGVSLPALSFLMAAHLVQPSRRSGTAIPPGLQAMWRGERPAGPLSKVERAWLETCQEKWLARLREAAKEQRKRRKLNPDAEPLTWLRGMPKRTGIQ